MFSCNRCGECCRNLDKSDIYDDLHFGDGICIHYDERNKLCRIYEERPDICNIDIAYEKYFSDKFSKEDYYNLNYEGCRALWKRRKKIKKHSIEL